MPAFFDYHKEIKNELEIMGYEVDYFNDRPSTKGIVKAIIRVKKELLYYYINSYFKKIFSVIYNKKYDYVLVISGQSFSFTIDMFKKIKSSQPQARFVLYQWDSLVNYSFIQNLHVYFDKIYSFDRADAAENDYIEFLPLFYTKKYEQIGMNVPVDYKYDFSFVGTAHPKKYKYINLMSKQLEAYYPKQFIYFFYQSRIVYFYRKLVNSEMKYAKYSEFHYTALSGAEITNVIVNSKCILDSPQDGQTGLTIRILEALGAKRKLITNNTDVVNYDFYKKENIYVYNGVIDYDSTFFKHPYVDIDEEIYTKYSLRNWLLSLLS
jgi:hypothetical protein